MSDAATHHAQAVRKKPDGIDGPSTSIHSFTLPHTPSAFEASIKDDSTAGATLIGVETAALTAKPRSAVEWSAKCAGGFPGFVHPTVVSEWQGADAN
jgi:hypothetical protein